jgi:hypothetical protein
MTRAGPQVCRKTDYLRWPGLFFLIFFKENSMIGIPLAGRGSLLNFD